MADFVLTNHQNVSMKRQIALFFLFEILFYFFQNVNITNFTNCWADGLAFCALIHHFFPQVTSMITMMIMVMMIIRIMMMTMMITIMVRWRGLPPVLCPDSPLLPQSETSSS